MAILGNPFHPETMPGLVPNLTPGASTLFPSVLSQLQTLTQPPPSPPQPDSNSTVSSLFTQAITPVQDQASPLGTLGLMAQLAALRHAQGSASTGGALPGGVTMSGGLPASGSASDQRFLNILKQQLGSPYVFGAEGQIVGQHRTFDCSGLVDWALNQAGIKVPRLTAAGYQQMFGTSVGPKNLQPGDPVFFWYPNDRGIPQGQASHIGIYWGNGKFIEAPHTGDVVKIAPMDWSAFIGGARIPGLWGG